MRTILITAISVIFAATIMAQPPGRQGAGGPPEGRRGPGGPGAMQGDWIKLLDSNMDQVMDAAEFQSAIDRTFADMDKDGNGTIEAAEVPHMGPPPGGRMDGERPDGMRMQGGRPDQGMRPGGGGMMQPGRPEGARLDTAGADNKRLLPPFFFMRGFRDGASMTKAQFESEAKSVFKDMDKNGDGVLSKSEARPPRREGDGPDVKSEPAGPPPPPNAHFVAAELRFGDRLVKGQPFSADTVIEDTRRLYDGSTATKRSSGAIYRDGAGRTRREQPLEMVGGYSVVGQDNKKQMLVFINDFPNGTQYFLDTNNKAATRHELGGTPPPEPPQPDNAKTESLGTKVIEGVSCEGTRITFDIPAGQLGDKAATVVTENWFSPELQMIVLSRHVDPIAGEHVFKLVNIKRAEPAADLFSVPTGYRIQGPGQNRPRN